MNAFKSALIAAAMFMFAGFAAAEQVPVQGDNLKAYVVGEKGRTFTITGGERISFFTDGTFVNCNSKQSCDKGSYTIEPTRVMRNYDNWQANGSSAMPIIFKRDGTDEYFNIRKVSSRSEKPTLLMSDEFPSMSPSADELAAKKAAASAYLQSDVIKMVGYGSGVMGMSLSFEIESYPKKKETVTIKASAVGDENSRCQKGSLQTTFSVTAEGNLAVGISPLITGCSHFHLLIDPLSKKIMQANTPDSETKPNYRHAPGYKLVN